MQRLRDERFELHPLFRHYGANLLADSDAFDEVSRLHFSFYLAKAESAAPNVRPTGSLLAFHWLVVEQRNLRSALEWANCNDTAGSKRLQSVAPLGAHGHGVHLPPTEENSGS